MKIWIIDHYAVPEKYSPLIRQTNFAKYLMKFGNDVRIIAASSVHNSQINLITDRALYRNESEDGVNYTYVKCHSYSGNGLKRILNMLEFARKLPCVCKQLVKDEWKPDAILSCSMTLQACKSGIKLGKKYGARVVAQITDLWPESIVEYTRLTKKNLIIRYLRGVEKWIYINSDALIFSMEGAYDYIVEQGWENVIPREKVHYINNGVDKERFQYNYENYQIEDVDLKNNKIFKVVYTGSIRRVNNVGLLLEVAKVMQDKQIKFLVWGDGDELENLKKRVEKEKIGNVIFKGRVEKRFIPYILCNADLNYMHGDSNPLFRFGLSANKLFDYFAAGKPILSDLDAKYNPVTLMNAGIDVTTPTPEKIANAIENIKNLPTEEYEQYCRNSIYASDKYNFEKLTQELLKILSGD